jgi:hypothetical protein
MTDSLAVKVKDCPVHEEGHSVFLAPTLPLEGGITAEQDLFAAAGDERLLTRLWLKTFVTYGATGWDLCDGEGNDLPFSVEAILADWSLARPVANRASELYADSVISPFLSKPAGRSPTGRTRATTSRRPQPTN